MATKLRHKVPMAFRFHPRTVVRLRALKRHTRETLTEIIENAIDKAFAEATDPIRQREQAAPARREGLSSE